MHRYELMIFWSSEDEAFIADVPQLPGCRAHGNSQIEALDNAQEAMELWVDPRGSLATHFQNPRAGSRCMPN